jgi:hypothetical protein
VGFLTAGDPNLAILPKAKVGFNQVARKWMTELMTGTLTIFHLLNAN